MPWVARKQKNGKWGIFKKDTGEKVGESSTEAKAKASVRARYANSPEYAKK